MPYRTDDSGRLRVTIRSHAARTIFDSGEHRRAAGGESAQDLERRASAELVVVANSSKAISTSPVATPMVIKHPRLADLVGTWISTGTSEYGTAEIVYRFQSGGTYKHAAVLMQQRPEGVFSFTVAAKGTVTIKGDILTLRPTWGSKTLKDPEDPSRNYERPLADHSAERYHLKLSASRLVLSGHGPTLDFIRQD